jgi:hypothetical protein
LTPFGAFPVCGIEITKTCPSSRLNDDQTAFIYSYNGTVTNTGFGTLYNVTVVDDAPGLQRRQHPPGQRDGDG